MSYTGLTLLNHIISRLQTVRSLRATEVRSISRQINILEELRDQRIRHVRQRTERATYPRNPAADDVDDDAPIFRPQEINESDDHIERLSDHDLAAAEQAFIEERGYLDVQEQEPDINQRLILEEAEREYTAEAERRYITNGLIRRIRNRTERLTRPNLRRPQTLAIENFENNIRRRSTARERESRSTRLIETADAIVIDILHETARNVYNE